MSNTKRTPVEHFSERAPEWHLLYSKPTFKQRYDLFLGNVSAVLKPPAKILDFGCGAGVMACELAKRGYQVTGVDAAPGMVAASRNYSASNNIANVEFEQTDTVGDSLQESAYDAIICSSVIEYVEQDDALIKNLIRALKPGGYFFVSVPNKSSLIGKLEDILTRIELRGSADNNADVQFAHRRYGSREFGELLEKQGMRDVGFSYFECPYIGKLGWVLSKNRFIGVMNFVSSQKID